MANKLRLITKNISDISTLTETPTTLDTVNNLKNYARSVVFTTASFGVGGTHTIFSKLPETSSTNAVVLGRHNFPIGFQFRIYLYSDNAWTTLVHDSGIITTTEDTAGSDITNWGEFNWGTIVWGADSLAEEFVSKPNYIYWLDTIVVIQSMKIELYTPNQDVEIGRLVVGTYIEPTYNISYDHTLTWVENTKQYRKGGNTLRSTEQKPSRKLTFELRTINEDDRATLQTQFRNVGLRKDFFISLFPEDLDNQKIIDYSGMVKLTKIPSTSEYSPMYYNSKYEMEEV